MPCFCCQTMPKFTETDFYWDPKLITNGEPNFEPAQVSNKISKQELSEMRQTMRTAGGEDLKSANLIFIVLRVYTVLFIEAFVGILIFGLALVEKPGNLTTPLLINFVAWSVPSLGFLCWSHFYVRKAYGKICKVLELNEKLYLARGIVWIVRKDLAYVQIKIFEGLDLQQFSSGSGQVKQLVEENEIEKNISFDMIHQVSNKEILLKS